MTMDVATRARVMLYLESRRLYERIPAGNEGGGRFRGPATQIIALLKDWMNGKGSDDPIGELFKDVKDPKQRRDKLREAVAQMRKKALAAGDEEQAARLVPRRGADENELKLLLYQDAKLSARGQRDKIDQPSAKFTLQGTAHHNKDVAVYKDSDGRPSLFEENDQGRRGSLVEKFASLAELQQWAQSNGETSLAAWAGRERKKLPEGGALDLHTPAEVEKLAKGLDMTVPHSHTVIAAEGKRRVEAVLNDIDQMLADGGSDRALLARLREHRGHAPKAVIDELTQAVESGDKSRVRALSAGIRAQLNGPERTKKLPRQTFTKELQAAEGTPAGKPTKLGRQTYTKELQDAVGTPEGAPTPAKAVRKGATDSASIRLRLEGFDRVAKAREYMESLGLTGAQLDRLAADLDVPKGRTKAETMANILKVKVGGREQQSVINPGGFGTLANPGIGHRAPGGDLPSAPSRAPGRAGGAPRKAAKAAPSPADAAELAARRDAAQQRAAEAKGMTVQQWRESQAAQLDGLTIRQKRARLRAMGFSPEQVDELAPTAAMARKATPAGPRPSGLPTDRKPMSGDFEDLAARVAGKSEQGILNLIQDLNASELAALARKFQGGPAVRQPGLHPTRGLTMSGRTRGLRLPDGLTTDEKRRWLAQRLSEQPFTWRSEDLDEDDLLRSEDLEDDSEEADDETDDEPVDEMDLALEHYEPLDAAARSRAMAMRALGQDVTPGHDELHHYWTRGEGLAKWVGSPKPWTTLVAHLTKYVGPEKAKTYASRWFIEVFGFAAGSDLNRVTHGHPPRGHRVGPG